MSNGLERIPAAAAAIIAVLVVADCAIRLRGDEREPPPPASLASKSDPTAAKLEQCRSVKYEQNDTLLECRRIWAEKRHQFLGETSRSLAHPNGAAASTGSFSHVPPKDDRHLPSTSPTMPAQSE